MDSSINRALIFQGGGSLAAYEAGAYRAINEDLSAYFSTQGKGVEHLAKGYDIISIDEFEEGELPRKLFLVTLRRQEK